MISNQQWLFLHEYFVKEKSLLILDYEPELRLPVQNTHDTGSLLRFPKEGPKTYDSTISP